MADISSKQVRFGQLGWYRGNRLSSLFTGDGSFLVSGGMVKKGENK